MLIQAVKIFLLRVPLRTPFKTAVRTVESLQDIVVQVHTDSGQIGYGEAPPTAAITGETLETVSKAIHVNLAPCLIDQDIAALDAICDRIQDSVPGNGSAKAAMEIAIYDLHAQLKNMPLYRLLGGGAVALNTDLTISVDTVEKMTADALVAMHRGFTVLKIKLASDPVLDLQRVEAIHSAVGAHCALRLDANQSWTPAESISIMRHLEAIGIYPELLEQPVPAHDLAGLKFISERIRTPVMADESVFNLEQAAAVIEASAAKIINIKLMKTGGIRNALRIADLAAQHNIDCMMGCMLESSISVAAAAHVAAARSNVITKIDLDGPSLCAFNPVEGGATFDGSTIKLSEAPGLGIRSVAGLEPLLL